MRLMDKTIEFVKESSHTNLRYYEPLTGATCLPLSKEHIGIRLARTASGQRISQATARTPDFASVKLLVNKLSATLLAQRGYRAAGIVALFMGVSVSSSVVLGALLIGLASGRSSKLRGSVLALG